MMMLLVGLALAEPFAWTARTPVGEVAVAPTPVRLVREILELTVLSHDEVQVRTDYILDNPGEKVIVRFSVPVTSGGRGGGRASSAAASIRLTDATDEFVPCLVTTVPPQELPFPSVAGANQVTGACTADVVIPAGISRLRLSYEGELFYESQADATGIPVSDRTLLYDFRGAASWAGTPEQLDVTVNFGPFASATPVLPKKSVREGAFATWMVKKPNHAALGVLSLALGGAAVDAGHVVAKAPHVEGVQVAPVLHDRDPHTTWCGPATQLRVPVPLACGPTVWTTPATVVDVVDCTSKLSLVASHHEQPNGHVVVLEQGSDCFELRPAAEGCLGEVALLPSVCPTEPTTPDTPVP